MIRAISKAIVKSGKQFEKLTVDYEEIFGRDRFHDFQLKLSGFGIIAFVLLTGFLMAKFELSYAYSLIASLLFLFKSTGVSLN